jgi:hypothetical protein
MRPMSRTLETLTTDFTHNTDWNGVPLSTASRRSGAGLTSPKEKLTPDVGLMRIAANENGSPVAAMNTALAELSARNGFL